MTKRYELIALGGVGAKVRELEWHEITAARSDEDPSHEPTGDYEAVSSIGVYFIEMYFGSDSYGWSVSLNSDFVSDHDDPCAAKAAAQADYERRIRSALVNVPMSASDGALREALAAEILGDAAMTTPSIRKVLIHTLASLAASISLLERTPRAKKAAPSDKMFDQMIADYKAALEQGRAALSAPPQDVTEGIARIVTSELEQMHKEGVPMCMREGETTWRTYHAGFDLSMFAQRVSDAILASGLVTAAHPDEVTSQRTILSSDCVDPDVEAAIRADERERCAKVAEESHAGIHDHLGSVARNIAAAIRAGGKK